MIDQVNDKIVSMRREIEAARQAEEEMLGGEPSTGSGGDNIDSRFVRSCLYNNERGDGILFAAIHRDRFLQVKTTSQWLAWGQHHWITDKADLCHDAVEQVAAKYYEQAHDLKTQAEAAYEAGKVDEGKRCEAERKLYLRRVDRLRSSAGAKNCLEWAHKIGARSLAIIGEEIDQRPMLLACKNGVIDLKTGKRLDGRPSDYLVKAIPVEWQGLDAPRPEWERFLSEIHLGDGDLVAFVRRLFGYAVTGLISEHHLACFVGEGRNGKGTMFETLKAIMGELAWAVQPELILDQKNTRSSAGPSPDLVSLQGRRLVIASETDEGRRISGSKVKSLTGADTINARAPHDRFETNFTPTHKLFLYTNHIPKGLTRDYALYKRLLFINYPLKFVDNPTGETERQRDPSLPAKLMAEAPGILAWLVQGCLEWQEHGLAPPDKLRADVDALRASEDTFQQFFTDRMLDDKDSHCLFKDIYTKFQAWYTEEIDENTRYIPSKIKISGWLEKRGYEKAKPGGHATFYGVGLRP